MTKTIINYYFRSPSIYTYTHIYNERESNRLVAKRFFKRVGGCYRSQQSISLSYFNQIFVSNFRVVQKNEYQNED